MHPAVPLRPLSHSPQRTKPAWPASAPENSRLQQPRGSLRAFPRRFCPATGWRGLRRGLWLRWQTRPATRRVEIGCSGIRCSGPRRSESRRARTCRSPTQRKPSWGRTMQKACQSGGEQVRRVSELEARFPIPNRARQMAGSGLKFSLRRPPARRAPGWYTPALFRPALPGACGPETTRRSIAAHDGRPRPPPRPAPLQ